MRRRTSARRTSTIACALTLFGASAGALSGTTGCDAVFDASSYHVGSSDTTNGADGGGGEDASKPSCVTTADCAASGEYSVCRSGSCVSLQTADCTRIVGDYKNDNAIFVGSLSPTAGADQSTGLPIQNSIEVAIEDFRKSGNVVPVPGSSARRPIVMVGCNDASDDEVAVRAARHLVDNVKVPVIIGAAFSGITIKVATDVTIPGGVMLISPSATSVAITSLADNDLVWRTSPSDVIQADAHAAFFPLVETDVKANIGGGAVKVAIAHKGDAYGAGLAQSLAQKLVMNGAGAIDSANDARFKVFDYGDPDDAAKPPNYAGVINDVIGLLPHVVYLFGTTESITDVMKGIEAQWPAATAYKPVYLAADGALVTETWALVDTNDDLRKRIFGTVPGTNNANFKTFRILYDSIVKDGTSPDTGGAANAYDALYNIAYAAVAIGDKPLTGANLKDGFAKLVPPGTALNVGSGQINTAFQSLLAGQGFDFAGASGPLDYDLKSGEAASDIQIWCMPQDGAKAGAGKSSEQFYDAANKKFEGTLEKVRLACGM